MQQKARFPIVLSNWHGRKKKISTSRSLMEESELGMKNAVGIYVGITRAEESLYLTNAFSRTLYGKHNTINLHAFVAEIDDSR